ncbi:hypothetical protein [Ensifer adhaerens]|uniref:hypothetical protein n=1 Tax=Ensifer adhaerens TaxID=106592 RepID=UPI00069E38A6|nr:hypothetical protein [Ensifer adhaerens]
MNENYILVASILCFLVGFAFCWPPIWRYLGKSKVTGFGYFLVFMGVILMTTFKWSEVVVEAQGYKLQIAQAQQQIAELNKRVSARDVVIADYRKGLSEVAGQIQTTGQADAYTAIFQKWSDAGLQVTAPASSGQLGLAALNAGYRLVPVTAVEELERILVATPERSGLEPRRVTTCTTTSEGVLKCNSEDQQRSSP